MRGIQAWLALSGWRVYGLALVGCALATLLSVWLSPLVAPAPMMLYLVTVITVAWLGGPLVGLLAGLLSGAALYVLFLGSADNLTSLPARGVFPLVTLLLTGGVVGLLAAGRRRAETQRAQAVASEMAVLAAAKVAQHRAGFLAEVGTLLSASLDFDVALDNLARLAVTWKLADWCLVDVFDADGSLRRVAAVHGDPAKQVLVTELQQRYGKLGPRAPHTLWKVLRPEQPWIDPAVDEVRLEAEARDPEHYRLLRTIGFKTEMVVPLTARGRQLGAITLVRGSADQPYGPEDLTLAEELARRAGLAADNARLYAEAQRLNAELEQRVRERTVQLEQQIAEHERTLVTLQENERRLAEAQQIAHLGSWHHDLGTDGFTWSDELYRLYGLEPQTVIITFTGYCALVHPDDRERVTGLLKAARRSGQPFDFEHRIVWPNGEVRLLHARGTVTLGTDGQPTAMEGTAEDITERQRLAAELVQSHAELSRLSAHLQTAREEERARIAREIHDELGGSLTGVKMDVARLRRLGAAGSPEWLAQVDTVLASLDDTVKTVRRIATELRPAILDDFGLVAAIEWQLKEFRARSGLTCTLKSAYDHLELDHESATALFRVFQETLTNVARHANASRVDVQLGPQAGGLSLRVSDDGCGIDPLALAQAKTFGLVGMRERVRMLAGKLDIESSPGQGTTVLVEVPLASANDRGDPAAETTPPTSEFSH